MRLSKPAIRTIVWAPLLASAVLALPSAQGASVIKPGPPGVSTGGVSHVKGTSGVLNGSVNPRTSPTTYYFQYGPTTAYGSQTASAMLAAGTAKIKVAKAVSALRTGYHYRLTATNGFGTSNGKDHLYTTSPTRLKFKLTKPNGQTVLGSSVVISGALTGTGSAAHKVVLQINPFPYKEGFTDASPIVTTDPLGRFSIRVARLTQNSQFRVITLDARPTYSQPIKVQAAVRVTLHVRSSSARGLVRLYGTVSPAQAKAKVAVQFQEVGKPPKAPRSLKAEEKAEETAKSNVKYATKFRTSIKRGTHSLSRFSIVVLIRQGGHYRALVEVAPGAVSSGYSPVVLLHSAPSGSKKKKK